MAPVHAFTDDVLGDHDAVGVAGLIARGDVTAYDVAEASVWRAEKVNPALNAIQLKTFDRAMATAHEPRWGVFAGVPTFVKDNTDVRGLPSNQGSLAVNAGPAAFDRGFAAQYLAQGFTLLGKSTMPEFGFNATTEYQTLPPTCNPWDTGYSSGASSGGSAALVAAGAVPIAHANDGGGSIRIPAACCGLVGLKPTRGRVVDAPESRTMPVNIISNGVVTRSVRDTAHFFAGAEQHYLNPRLEKIGLVTGPSARRLTVGLVLDSVTRRTDDDTRAAVSATARLLEEMGHRVVEIPLPVTEQFAEDFQIYWGFLAFSIVRLGKVAMGKGFDRTPLDNLTIGLADLYRRNIRKSPGVFRRLRRGELDYRRAFEDAGIDVILSPTLAHTTPELGYLSPVNEFGPLFERLTDYVSFTPLNNVAGSPAISLPLGRGGNGMPIGVHLSGKHGDERTLLELAFELEEAQPFARIQD